MFWWPQIIVNICDWIPKCVLLSNCLIFAGADAGADAGGDAGADAEGDADVDAAADAGDIF